MNGMHKRVFRTECSGLRDDKNRFCMSSTQNAERNPRFNLAQNFDAVDIERTAYMHRRVAAGQDNPRDPV